jgi:hypothetical protein
MRIRREHAPKPQPAFEADSKRYQQFLKSEDRAPNFDFAPLSEGLRKVIFG